MIIMLLQRKHAKKEYERKEMLMTKLLAAPLNVVQDIKTHTFNLSIVHYEVVYFDYSPHFSFDFLTPSLTRRLIYRCSFLLELIFSF